MHYHIIVTAAGSPYRKNGKYLYYIPDKSNRNETRLRVLRIRSMSNNSEIAFFHYPSYRFCYFGNDYTADVLVFFTGNFRI